MVNTGEDGLQQEVESEVTVSRRSANMMEVDQVKISSIKFWYSMDIILDLFFIREVLSYMSWQ